MPAKKKGKKGKKGKKKGKKVSQAALDIPAFVDPFTCTPIVTLKLYLATPAIASIKLMLTIKAPITSHIEYIYIKNQGKIRWHYF